jgi:RNA polymerase sigma-70 factor (ECF subfamily)
MSDEQLILKLSNGDTAALELFYDRYAPAVMGLAMKMLNDQAIAEEIVQETFWRVWCQAGTFSSKQGTVSGWVFGIARNLAIDTWRRRKVRPQPVLGEEEVELFEAEADPEADVDASAWTAIKHAQVRQALASLPPEQRQVLELAYFGGMTRQEIAQTTGIPIGTVHTRARLGLQKLRESLQGQGFEDE